MPYKQGTCVNIQAEDKITLMVIPIKKVYNVLRFANQTEYKDQTIQSVGNLTNRDIEDEELLM